MELKYYGMSTITYTLSTSSMAIRMSHKVSIWFIIMFVRTNFEFFLLYTPNNHPDNYHVFFNIT